MTESRPSRRPSAPLGNDRFVLQKAHERGVTVVELWAVDPLGQVRVVTVPIDALDVALDDGFPVTAEALGETFGEGGELYLAPDPATFCLLAPATSSGATARFFCDFRQDDGSPSPLCVRSALKRALGRATQLGSTFYVGATIQHHWLASFDEEGALGDRRKVRALCQHTANALDMLGIAWRAHYPGPAGRFRLALDWVDPLTLADALATHRRVTQDLAQDHGVVATFAPHPWPSAPRSRLDLFVSLMRDGAAAFHDARDARGLSPIARGFAQALEAELGGLDLVFRATPGSYAAADAPRVKRGPESRGEGGPTVLVEGIDACASPHTVLALTIGLGVDAPETRPQAATPPAASLAEAAHRATASARIRDVLGGPLVECLARVG